LEEGEQTEEELEVEAQAPTLGVGMRADRL
jgi:hypothetical protein